MDTAESIAAAIIASVEDCCSDKITLAQHSKANLAHWSRALELGLHDQVNTILQAYNLAEMDQAVNKVMPHRRAWIKVTQPVTVGYAIDASETQERLLRPSVIGNVCGHTRGVELYPHRNGTVTVILRAEFVETWERIPETALELGPLLELLDP